MAAILGSVLSAASHRGGRTKTLRVRLRKPGDVDASHRAGETTMNTPVPPSSMWYEQLPKDKSWSGLWSGYTICGRCHGIRAVSGACGVCGDAPYDMKPQLMRDDQGREFLVSSAVPGAEGRYEDWMYLGMIEREWKRPVLDSDRFPGLSPDKVPSPRASIVLLFWSYFESRIERLLRAGLNEVPSRLLDDTLRRYSAIGARLNDLFRI